jgi:hypothetical protein
MSDEALSQRIQELEKAMFEDIDGVNYVVGEFNFDKCMDLLRLVPSDRL